MLLLLVLPPTLVAVVVLVWAWESFWRYKIVPRSSEFRLLLCSAAKGDDFDCESPVAFSDDARAELPFFCLLFDDDFIIVEAEDYDAVVEAWLWLF